MSGRPLAAARPMPTSRTQQRLYLLLMSETLVLQQQVGRIKLPYERGALPSAAGREPQAAEFERDALPSAAGRQPQAAEREQLHSAHCRTQFLRLNRCRIQLLGGCIKRLAHLSDGFDRWLDGRRKDILGFRRRLQRRPTTTQQSSDHGLVGTSDYAWPERVSDADFLRMKHSELAKVIELISANNSSAMVTS